MWRSRASGTYTNNTKRLGINLHVTPIQSPTMHVLYLVYILNPMHDHDMYMYYRVCMCMCVCVCVCVCMYVCLCAWWCVITIRNKPPMWDHDKLPTTMRRYHASSFLDSWTQKSDPVAGKKKKTDYMCEYDIKARAYYTTLAHAKVTTYTWHVTDTRTNKKKTENNSVNWTGTFAFWPYLLVAYSGVSSYRKKQME